MTFDLSAQLSGQVFAFMLIFTRLSAGMMMFPGLGEAFVSARTRLLFSFALSLLMMPVLASFVPPMPEQIGSLAFLLGKEALIGLFFSSLLRLIMGIIEIAGTVVAMETGLSNAMILNPALADQSALTSALLSTAAIALFFLSGMDHVLFRALMETYNVFPVGETFPVGDAAESFVRILSKCFVIGVQMASPFIVVGLLLYLTMGVMQKMMAQVQLFLVLIPVQIWGGFSLLSATVGAMLVLWLRAYDNITAEFLIR